MHLPDLGISEYLGIPKASAPVNNNYLSAGQYESTPSNVNNAPAYSTIKKSSGGSSSGSSKTSNSLSAQQKSLSKGFSSTIGAYGKMIKALPGQQQEDSQQISNLAGSQKNSINDALTSALQLLTNNRSQVASNQSQTLQDLASNTRNAFQAGNVYLGAQGAGDSSATGMYSAALTQAANKQRADIQNQYNSQYNDINNTQVQTQAAAQQQLDQVDTWQNTQMTQLKTQFQDLQRQLESAKANASDQEKQAINQLQTNLLTTAQNQVSNLQTVAAQYKAALGTAIGTQQSALNTAGIGNTAAQSNSAVQFITAQQIASTPTMAQQSDGSFLDTATGIIYTQNQDGTYSQSSQMGGNSNLGNTAYSPVTSLSQF